MFVTRLYLYNISDRNLWKYVQIMLLSKSISKRNYATCFLKLVQAILDFKAGILSCYLFLSKCLSMFPI